MLWEAVCTFAGHFPASLSSVMQNCAFCYSTAAPLLAISEKSVMIRCSHVLWSYSLWFLWSDLHMFCASSAEINFYEIDVHAFLMFLMLLLYVVPAHNAVQSHVPICCACFLLGSCSSDGSHHFLCVAHCSSKFFPRALCNASHEPQPTRRAGATRKPRTNDRR